MPYDVDAVRAHFPALHEGAAHFDGPGGSQVPDVVADAVAGTYRSAIANRGTITVAERRADAIVVAARQAVADLLGADPGGIVFGRSMTQVTYDLARTMARTWGEGDEIVVTRLDHDANIRPWIQAAQSAGATVRWAGFDRETAELGVDDVTAELSDRTRLVAVTGASNLLGSRPPVRAIADRVHEAGALLYVDGVHLTPHASVDVAELGADFYACSPYKFLGPHLGAVAADPALLETLRPDKLVPMADTVPERFELGTLPYELLAGTTAAIDFLAGLAFGAGGDADPAVVGPSGPPGPSGVSRRERLVASMRALEEHEAALLQRLDAGLAKIDGVTLLGSSARRRTPTVLFTVAGLTPQAVYERLAEHGVNAPAGSFYAVEAAHWLGLGDAGAVRAGIGAYTNTADVDRLIDAVPCG